MRTPSGRTVALVPTVALAVLVAACGRPQAWGEDNTVIVLTSDALWAEVEDTTYTILEPTIFTTRAEKRFVVTHAGPDDEDLRNFLQFRNVVVAAPPGDERLADIADAAGHDTLPSPPALLTTPDVWATGQLVVGAVLNPEAPAGSWTRQLPEILAVVDSAFRRRTLARMYVTGLDTALTRDVEERFGFSLSVPNVYEHRVVGDSIFMVRNDNPDPGQLIRQVAVAWREPGPDSLTAELAYEWRAAIDSTYVTPQRFDRERGNVTRFLVDGHEGLEVTGVWEDEGTDFPAAGPFIAWLVRCPERTYFLDAWLYAPGEGEGKYPYMLQLQQILGSFACGSGGGTPSAGAPGPEGEAGTVGGGTPDADGA